MLPSLIPFPSTPTRLLQGLNTYVLWSARLSAQGCLPSLPHSLPLPPPTPPKRRAEPHPREEVGLQAPLEKLSDSVFSSLSLIVKNRSEFFPNTPLLTKDIALDLVVKRWELYTSMEQNEPSCDALVHLGLSVSRCTHGGGRWVPAGSHTSTSQQQVGLLPPAPQVAAS